MPNLGLIPTLSDTNWDTWHRLTLLTIFITTRKGYGMVMGLVHLPGDWLLEENAHLWDEAAKALDILIAKVEPTDWPHIERAAAELAQSRPLDPATSRHPRSGHDAHPPYHPRRVFLALQAYYGPHKPAAMPTPFPSYYPYPFPYPYPHTHAHAHAQASTQPHTSSRSHSHSTSK